MVASVFEIFLGASGILTILLRFIGPLTVAPTIMMVGLGVVKTGYELAGSHWGIAFGYVPAIIKYTSRSTIVVLLILLPSALPLVQKYILFPCRFLLQFGCSNYDILVSNGKRSSEFDNQYTSEDLIFILHKKA